MSMDKNVKMLVDNIKVTKEFRELKEARKNLDKHTNIKSEMEALENKQMELYNSKLPPKDFELEMKALNDQYKKLSDKPEVMNMVKALESFNKLMNDIYLDISKMLDSEF